MKIMIPDYMAPDPKDAGEVLLSARLYREALPFLQARYEKYPDMPRPRVALGLCLFYHDRFEEAEAMVQSVVESHPDQAMSWHALGNIVEGLGRFDEALACYQNAASIRPDVNAINYGVASNLMRNGRFDEAWEYWEKGRSILSVDTVPIWDGEDLAGKKILVIREGGLGDILWLIRYLPLLQQMGAQVTLYSYTGLRGLLAGHPWVDTYVDSEEVIETSGFDFQVSMMSIMAVTRRCPVGMDAPYFTAPNPAPRNGRKRVGICWRAGEHGGVVRKIRTIPVEEIEPLREIDVEWVNLQLDEKPPEWMADNRAEIKGWVNTANTMASLDAVVSCDTSVLHLAGAMGRPTLGILPKNWEWKWVMDRDWYPTMDTVRSSNPISFKSAIKTAVGMVKEMVC